MEVLRRTGPLVRLRLLRKAVCLSHILPPVPPLQPLRHSHSFHEGNPYRVGLNKIQETGAPGLRDGQHIDSFCCNGTMKPTCHRHEAFVHSRRNCYSGMFCLGGWRTLRLLGSLLSAEVFFTLTALGLDRGFGCVISRCLTNMFPIPQESAHCVKSPGERRTPTDDLGMIARTVSSSSHVFHQPRLPWLPSGWGG